jgi:hypothetical protein
LVSSQIRLSLALMAVVGWSVETTAQTSTVTAASCSQGHVQTAVDTASDGQTVFIPAGRCTWSEPVAWESKNIWVRGAGIDQTVITEGAQHVFFIAANASGKAKFRVSDMTLTGVASASGVVTITTANNPGVNSGWRVDHIKFDFPNGGHRAGVWVNGVSYGVIDHNEFNWSQGLVVIASASNLTDGCTSSNPTGNFINSQPLDLGTANAIYIEDNTFRSNADPVAAYDTSAGGARVVFRHNAVIGGYFYSHWTRGCEIGGIVHEIYNNVWTGNPVWNAYIARIESGTGVVFNNTVQGFGTSPSVILDERRGARSESSGVFGACDGTKSWDGNRGDPAAPGWPCLGQIGRAPGKSAAAIMAGDKQASAPLYLWNNGSENGCATGGACGDYLKGYVDPSSAAYIRSTPHPNGEVDFVNNNTPKPGYTPFVYPHPTVSGSPVGSASGGSGSSAPAPPTNVRVVSGL